MKTLSIIFLVAILFSCGNSEIKTKQNNLETSIQADPKNIMLHVEYLRLLFLELGDYKGSILYYEDNNSILLQSVEGQCIYGAALCALGGETEKIEEKLLLLKKGMLVLEQMVEESDDSVALLWRLQTYSHFPEIMNVRSIVEEDIDKLLKNYNLSQGTLAYIFDAQLNIVQEYHDIKLLDKTEVMIVKQLSGEQKDILLERVVSLRKKLGGKR